MMATLKFISPAGCFSSVTAPHSSHLPGQALLHFLLQLFFLSQVPAQSVNSQSISTLFLIGADAIKIIAVYEKQSCWRKCEIELLDNLNDQPFLWV